MDSVNFIKKDGASRGAHAAQALALRERLRCASDTITLGTLVILGTSNYRAPLEPFSLSSKMNC
jgi:hypothetical protein